MALDCLETIIGLTDKDSVCVDDTDQPENYTTSDSGYYITDHEYGFPMRSAILQNLDANDSFWQTMIRAKDRATEDFKLDIRAALAQTRVQGVGNWDGLIGRIKHNSINLQSDSILGLQLRPKRLRDTYLIIKSIYVGLDQTKSFEATLKSNDPNFEEQTITLSSVANQFTKNTLASEIKIPLYSGVQDQLYYYLEYDRGTANPLNNEIWCGCGGENWMRSLEVGSYAAEVNDFDLYSCFYGKQAHGLALDAYIDCATLDWICSLTEVNGYSVRDVIARAIQMKAAIKLSAYVLTSGKVNTYSVLQSEKLSAKAMHLNQLYQDNINWIAQNLPENITACWGCQKGQPHVKPFLV